MPAHDQALAHDRGLGHFLALELGPALASVIGR
jgi:hypothetical protein